MHTKSDSIAGLAKALAAAQAEIENAHKTSANPHFRSKYADLAEVINTVRPVLAKHGLSVTQWPSYLDGIVSVETILTHESGEWIANTASAPADKLNAQGVGSATTYLRRYSLAALACVAQEDDDGNKASEREGQISARKSAAQAKRDGDNETIKAMLQDATTLEDLDARWQVVQEEWLPRLPEKWEDHTRDFYENARAALKAKGA